MPTGYLFPCAALAGGVQYGIKRAARGQVCKFGAPPVKKVQRLGLLTASVCVLFAS